MGRAKSMHVWECKNYFEVLYFPFCTKIITHHQPAFLSDVCEQLPSTLPVVRIRPHFDCRTHFSPRLSLRAVLRWIPMPLMVRVQLPFMWSGIPWYMQHLLCRHFWSCSSTCTCNIILRTYLGGKRICALQQQYAYSLCWTKLVQYDWIISPCKYCIFRIARR